MVSQVVLFSDDSNLTSDSFLIFVKMPEKNRYVRIVFRSLTSNDVLFVLELQLQNRSYLHQLIHFILLMYHLSSVLRKRSQMKWYLETDA